MEAHVARAGEHTTVGVGAGAAVEDERGARGDGGVAIIAEGRRGASGVADLQGAGADGGRARVGVGAGQVEDTRAGVLGQRARAADHAGEALLGRGREGDRAGVGDGAGVPTHTELARTGDGERTRANRCRTSVAILSGERQRAEVEFGQGRGARAIGDGGVDRDTRCRVIAEGESGAGGLNHAAICGCADGQSARTRTDQHVVDAKRAVGEVDGRRARAAARALGEGVERVRGVIEREVGRTARALNQAQIGGRGTGEDLGAGAEARDIGAGRCDDDTAPILGRELRGVAEADPDAEVTIGVVGVVNLKEALGKEVDRAGVGRDRLEVEEIGAARTIEGVDAGVGQCGAGEGLGVAGTADQLDARRPAAGEREGSPSSLLVIVGRVIEDERAALDAGRAGHRRRAGESRRVDALLGQARGTREVASEDLGGGARIEDKGRATAAGERAGVAGSVSLHDDVAAAGDRDGARPGERPEQVDVDAESRVVAQEGPATR